VQDTWVTRELPVLDATVSLLDESYMVTVSDIAARTGLEAATVARALEALDPVFLDFRKTTTGGDPTFWYVLKVTPQARSAVGQWPTPDSFVTKLAAELSAAAGQEDDAERKGLLSYAARLIGDTLREAAVRAAGQVLAPALGPVLAPQAPSRPASDEPLPLAEAARAASSSGSSTSASSSPSSGPGSPSPFASGPRSPSTPSSSSSPSAPAPALAPLPDPADGPRSSPGARHSAPSSPAPSSPAPSSPASS
jgi:hypothetical protein